MVICPGFPFAKTNTSGRARVPAWVGDSLGRVSHIFNSSLRSPLPSHAPGVSLQTQATSGNNPGFSQQDSNRATPSGSGRTVNNASSKLSGHIFIGIKCKDEHRIVEINVHGFGDDQFFKELRTEYYELKGYLRRYFSIWRFKHCDFVKVNTTLAQHYALHSSISNGVLIVEKFDYESSVPRYEDLPENNPEYLYIPKPRKPSDPMPPIHLTSSKQDSTHATEEANATSICYLLATPEPVDLITTGSSGLQSALSRLQLAFPSEGTFGVCRLERISPSLWWLCTTSSCCCCRSYSGSVGCLPGIILEICKVLPFPPL